MDLNQAFLYFYLYSFILFFWLTLLANICFFIWLMFYFRPADFTKTS